MVFSKVLNLISSKSIVSFTILPQVWKQKVFRKKEFKIVLLVMGAILNSFSKYFFDFKTLLLSISKSV
jgi:hypothetical protein